MKNEQGYVYANYIPMIRTGPPTARDQKHKKLLDRYRENHTSCPKCGFLATIMHTYEGYVMDMDRPERYSEHYDAVCKSCGWAGDVHQLVPAKDTKKLLRDANKGAEVNAIMARSLAKQVNELTSEVARLTAVIKATIENNLHLSDGDNCTLIDLKRAIDYKDEDYVE